MANNNKHTGPNVPALRFPEFGGEWETFLLSDLASFSKERVKIETLSTDNYVSTEDMQQDFAGVKEAISLPSSGNAVAFQIGDILISNIRPYLRKIWLADRNGGCSTDVLSLRTKNEKVDSAFLYCCLANDGFVSYVMSGAKGVKMPRGDKQHISSFSLGVPTIKEQKKISDLISLLETRISTQIKIIEGLTTLRSALHHQIMRNGLADGSWEHKMLSEVLSERTELNSEGHAVHSVSVSKGIVNQIEYLGRSFAAKDTSKYHVACPGDIVYTKSPTGEFPYGIVKQSQITIKAALSPLYGVYTPASSEIGYIIHNHFLSAKNALNYLHPLIQKGAKNTINITNQRFLQNIIPLPLNQNAADLYSRTIKAVSDKIAIEGSILNKLQLQKSYFLQAMFI